MLIAPWPSHGAIAHVQSVSCLAFSTNTCTTSGVTTTTGNLFVTASTLFDGTFTSVTDSKSNSYSVVTSGFTTVNVADGRQDYKANGAGGASHTFTLTTSGSFAAFAATEISGAATTTPLDKNTGAADIGTSHSSTSTSATSQANELLYGSGIVCENSTMVTDTGAGWTERINDGNSGGNCGVLIGTKAVSATGTYAYTWTTSSSQDAISIISTWKEAAASGVRQRCIGCGIDKKVIDQ